MERADVIIASPVRNPRRVRAGTYEVTVVDGGAFGGTRKERRPIHICTTKVLSHALAQELRSRVHTHVDAEGAEAS